MTSSTPDAAHSAWSWSSSESTTASPLGPVRVRVSGALKRVRPQIAGRVRDVTERAEQPGRSKRVVPRIREQLRRRARLSLAEDSAARADVERVGEVHRVRRQFDSVGGECKGPADVRIADHRVVQVEGELPQHRRRRRDVGKHGAMLTAPGDRVVHRRSRRHLGDRDGPVLQAIECRLIRPLDEKHDPRHMSRYAPVPVVAREDEPLTGNQRADDERAARDKVRRIEP